MKEQGKKGGERRNQFELLDVGAVLDFGTPLDGGVWLVAQEGIVVVSHGEAIRAELMVSKKDKVWSLDQRYDKHRSGLFGSDCRNRVG